MACYNNRHSGGASLLRCHFCCCLPRAKAGQATKGRGKAPQRAIRMAASALPQPAAPIVGARRSNFRTIRTAGSSKTQSACSTASIGGFMQGNDGEQFGFGYKGDLAPTLYLTEVSVMRNVLHNFGGFCTSAG